MNKPALLPFVLFPLLYVTALAGPLIERGAELELISSDFELADGPAWSGSHLYISDVKGDTLYRYNPKTQDLTKAVNQAGRISASFFNNGRLYLSDNANARISWLKGGKSIDNIITIDESDTPQSKPNDLVVDDLGGIYFTLTRQGQVIYVDRSGKRAVAIDNLSSPNGLILAPNQKTLYVSATATKQIWSYSLNAPGQTEPGTLFASMDSGPERGADGMCVDRAGNVYCAGPKHVWIWSPSGELLEKIETPERPINLTFGDNDQRTLYITGFGGLYRIRMNAYGVPQNPPFEAAYQSGNANRPKTTIPESVQAYPNIVYGVDSDRQLLCDIFRPKTAKEPLPAILVVHGGGWLNGSKNKFRALAIALAEQGFVSVAVEYRLGHEAKFPVGIQDCNAVTAFIKANAQRFGIDSTRVGAVGGSAGGHLVGLMATAWENPLTHRNIGHDPKTTRLDVAIVMGGPMRTTTGSVAERSRNPKSGSNSNIWLDATVDENPQLYALADPYIQIDKGDPPIYFLEGEFDNPERNQATRDRLKSLGIATGLRVYKDGKHGCWNNHPWFDPMVADMVEIFKKHL